MSLKRDIARGDKTSLSLSPLSSLLSLSSHYQAIRYLPGQLSMESIYVCLKEDLGDLARAHETFLSRRWQCLSREIWYSLERYDILQGCRRDLARGDISHERFRSRRWRSLENTLSRIFSWEYSLEKLSWEISLEAISLLGVSPTVMISRKRRDPVSSRRWRYLVFDVIVFSLKRDSDSIDISLKRLQYSLHRIFVRGRGNISLERSRSRLIDRSRGNISHGRSRSRR